MAYGIFRKVTTLEFLQHHLAKSGHGDGLLMARQLISTARQPPLHYLTRSVRRTSGFVLADHSTHNNAPLREALQEGSCDVTRKVRDEQEADWSSFAAALK